MKPTGSNLCSYPVLNHPLICQGGWVIRALTMETGVAIVETYPESLDRAFTDVCCIGCIWVAGDRFSIRMGEWYRGHKGLGCDDTNAANWTRSWV